MTFISYAQNFEDVVLWRALGDVERGFYIDVGAAHPDTDSVTRAFYERGWRGINIEPVPDYARRLRASRPGDITLEVAASDEAGMAELLVVPGTGLSTLDGAHLSEAQRAAPPLPIATMTLADICRSHAPPDIHFLKVDVEGSERRVLAGADFASFRPWVVVVEATVPMSSVANHHGWEGLLLASGYRFALFDGLNRFYVAAEHEAMRGHRLAVPANVMDDFLRAADGEWTRRVAEAETRADLLARRLQSAESRAAAIVAKLHATELQALGMARQAEASEAQAGRSAGDLDWLQATHAHMIAVAETALAVAERTRAEALGAAEQARGEARRAGEEARAASDWLAAMRRSSSWRLTAPLRRLGGAVYRLRGHDEPSRENGQPSASAAGAPSIEIPTTLPAVQVAARATGNPMWPARSRRVVHQFHSGSAVGDSITQAMLLTRRVLQGLGYASEIFVEHRPDALAGELRLLDELPLHDDYVLIVHHSMGYDALARVLARPAPKILLYHNITPPEFLGDDAFLQRYATLGRAQLATLRTQVAAALADSDYNALELRRLGFPAPRACTLLFDVAAMLAAAARHPPTRGSPHPGAPFTVLFVGRLIASKAQIDLVDAFAHFGRSFGKPARLVLVGRSDGPDVSGTDYDGAVRARIAAHRLDDAVTLTGMVSDTALRDWYAAADLYVSLSHHEGFGVPLLEAAAQGVPVLAWPAGAVGDTLGRALQDDADDEMKGPDGLLASRAPREVAARMLALARDPAARHRLAARQLRGVERFRLEHQVPLLVQALTAAGAAPPEQPDMAARLGRDMRFTVAGHVNKTYSLAAINRDLALAVDAERPGRVRLVPVETVPTDDLSEVPADLAARTAVLVQRPPHATGPEAVISQHYPVYLPEDRGDVCLALFFWEESLIPAETILRLNHGFDAVLAPTRFVAKALVDSGLTVPVHVIGHAPRLDGYAALAAARAAGAETGKAGGRAFTFLHVSSCFPRKGLDLLLAAYAASFRRRDRVRLVVKSFPNPHNDAALQIARLQAADPELPAVELIDEDLDEAGLQALYAEADVLVLPSRGEGFNLPAAEAMVAGLPLIVTGFGGHRDFCGPGTARLIDWRFAPSGSHLATPHSVWAEPDRDDLAAALREAVADPAASATRARRAQVAAARSFARQGYVERLAAAAAQALLTPPPPKLRLGWISTWQVRCGIAEYSRHLLDALPRTGLDRVVVFADGRTPATEHEIMRVRPAWRSAASLAGLLEAVAQEDPQVVVVQHQPGLFGWPVLARLLAGLADRNVLVTLHNTRDLLDRPPQIRTAALAALATAARVTVHTLRDLNFLKDLGLVDNVALLPHGAPPRASHSGSPARPSGLLPSPDQAGPLIGCYGFFLPDKGIFQLIEATALLRRRWPAARLRLVNAAYDAAESEEEIARCRALVERAGLGPAVEFHTAFRPDAESLALLAECDVIALPYQRSKEASSAAVRMVLAAGPPVMVTDLPLFEETGEAVLRSPGTDAEALARGLAGLLGDPARRAALQQAARTWLDARHWNAVAGRLHGMLLGMLLGSGHRPPDLRKTARPDELFPIMEAASPVPVRRMAETR